MTIEAILLRIAESLEELVKRVPVTDLKVVVEAYSSPSEHRGRPHGLIPHCTRCRAPHRMRHPKRNNRCIECEFEEEWDE